MTKNHINNLDGLRGFACLLVVISHCAKIGFLPSFLGNGLGQFGVMLFFCLSGFLMSYLYLSKSFSLKTVYSYGVSRVSRVYPLFAFAVFLHWLLFYFGFSADDVNTHAMPFIQIDNNDLWQHLIFQKGESVFWTISPEFRFYAFFILLWGLFALLVKKPPVFYAGIIILFILSSMLKYDGQDIHLLYSLNFFLAGTLIGDLYARYHDKLENLFTGYEFFIFGLLFCLSFPGVYFLLFDQVQEKFLNPVNPVLTGGLVLFAAIGGYWINILLGNPLARFFGKISFSVYLLHMPVLTISGALAQSLGIPAIVMFIPYVLAVTAVSTLTYYLVENPCRQGLKAVLLRRNDKQK